MRNAKKVFVGLSGGVDSSVAAYLLKKQGCEVVGIFMRCFNLDGCAEGDAEDARRAAGRIGIPFYSWDFEEEYKRRVVDYMISGYRQGITPNPDVMCNREIKFGMFFDRAMLMGADFVATGHYARVKKEKGKYRMFAGADGNKDQSYFLWTLGQRQLNKVLFPIGGLEKPEVRKIAKAARLNTAGKKDSQGICFLGKISLKDFLKRYLPVKKGDILNDQGEKIGEHEGVWFYTLGQRHGLNVPAGFPAYVSKKDLKKNTIVISKGEDPDLFSKKMVVSGLNWISGAPKMPAEVLARIRYRQPLSPAVINKLPENRIQVDFKEPQKFATPGQSAVFYSGKSTGEVLGGGVIESFI